MNNPATQPLFWHKTQNEDSITCILCQGWSKNEKYARQNNKMHTEYMKKQWKLHILFLRLCQRYFLLNDAKTKAF